MELSDIKILKEIENRIIMVNESCQNRKWEVFLVCGSKFSLLMPDLKRGTVCPEVNR